MLFRSTKVDVRVIAATNRDLAQAVKEGRFRADLLYRLNVFPIEIPSLRARASDVPLLVRFYADKFSKKFGKRLSEIPQASMDRLVSYAWPGNVRELENVIERAAIVSQGSALMIDDTLLSGTSGPMALSGTLEEMEKAYILQVLKDTEWLIEGKRGAAIRLGLHPNTLRSRMTKLGLKKPHPAT